MKIFIGYRHEDSEHATWRIYNRLESKYGKKNVFKDNQSIQPGADFRHAITDGVAKCDVMLAVIGPQWLNLTDRNRYRRLDDPRDYVRREIEMALARAIPVIPVLVQDAVMPHQDDLPPTLAPLASRQCFKVHGDPHFEGCLDLLSPSGGVLRFKSHDKRKTTTSTTAERWAMRETIWNIVGGENK